MKVASLDKLDETVLFANYVQITSSIQVVQEINVKPQKGDRINSERHQKNKEKNRYHIL